MSLSNRITVGAIFAIAVAMAVDGQMNPKQPSYKNDNRPAPAAVQQVDIPEPITNGCAEIYTSFEGIYAKNNCTFPIRVAYCQTKFDMACKPHNYRFPGHTIFPGTKSKLHYKDHPGSIRLNMITCAAPRRPSLQNGEFSCVR